LICAPWAEEPCLACSDEEQIGGDGGDGIGDDDGKWAGTSVQGLWCRIQGARSVVQCAECRVYGAECRAKIFGVDLNRKPLHC